MGFFSKITRAITKPIKKIIKSPLGKAALLGGLGYFAGPAMARGFGATGQGFMGRLASGGWQKALLNPMWTPAGSMTNTGPLSGIMGKAAGFIGKNKVPLAIAGAAGLGTAAMAKGAEQEEPSWAGESGTGHADYLKARKLWDWGGEQPMFSANQGGRVRAQQGMAVGQGQGIASLDQVTDPASLSDVSQPVDQGVLDSGTTEQSDDARLIQLIQQLASLGIPMEQLRGRTEQELVEMMVYLSSQMGSQQGGNQMAAAQGGRVGLRTGGDNSLFLEESSEVIRGGQDGDSVVDETENIEVASDPSLEDSRNEMSLMLFGKPIHELTDEELQILNDQGAMPAQSPIMANQGGRVGLFRGAEADARAGIASMSPGTHHGGGGREAPTGNGKGPSKNIVRQGLGAAFTLANPLKMAGVAGKIGKWALGNIIAGDELGYQGEGPYGNELVNQKDIDILTGTGGLSSKSDPVDIRDRITMTGQKLNPDITDTEITGVLSGGITHPGSYTLQDGQYVPKNTGGLMRTGYAMGTEHPIIPSKDGKQLDMRDTGGYQPHGAKEKHDDVRALLAQGEFVMTSDAVKGLGGGDREAGAKKMYDVMHNLEAMA